MPRRRRIQYPGAFYHIFNRGVEKRDIYLDEQDFRKFLKICSEEFVSLQFKIHCYCLMTNHYHLFMETPLGNLSQIMHEIDGRYSSYFNFKYGRPGPLFQNRFRSILVQDTLYSKNLSRYIDWNPKEAGMVRRLEDYPWSSYAAVIGKAYKESFLDRDWLLRQFGEDRSSAIRNYIKYVDSGLKDESWYSYNEMKRIGVLGDQKFVATIQKKHGIKNDDLQVLALDRINKQKLFLNNVNDLLAGSSFDQNLVKAITRHLLRKGLGISMTEITSLMGDDVNSNSISRSLLRLRSRLENSKDLKDYVSALEEKLTVHILGPALGMDS